MRALGRLGIAVVGVVFGLVLVTPAGVGLSPAAAESKPVLYLTFDDGPGVDTPKFLDLLERYDVQATFFATGRAVSINPDTARRVVSDGHAIANHTWNHPKLTGLSSAAIVREFVRTNEIIAVTTGVTPTCYRPPYGATSLRVHAGAVSAGLPNGEWTTGSAESHRGLWDIDTNDWRLSLASSSWTESKMMLELNRAGDGDTVLLHDGFSSRSRGLRVLGSWLAANHDRFEFRALPGCGGRLVEPEFDPERPQYWHRFQIARLYRAYFDRQPDGEGWAYWNRIHSQGHSIIDISYWFAQSSEFNEAGELSNEDFVRFVYREILEREPDIEGYFYWLDHLDRGLSRGDIVVYFSESEEYIEQTVAVMTGDCHQLTVEDSYRCWANRLRADE